MIWEPLCPNFVVSPALLGNPEQKQTVKTVEEVEEVPVEVSPSAQCENQKAEFKRNWEQSTKPWVRTPVEWLPWYAARQTVKLYWENDKALIKI